MGNIYTYALILLSSVSASQCFHYEINQNFVLCAAASLLAAAVIQQIVAFFISFKPTILLFSVLQLLVAILFVVFQFPPLATVIVLFFCPTPNLLLLNSPLHFDLKLIALLLLMTICIIFTRWWNNEFVLVCSSFVQLLLCFFTIDNFKQQLIHESILDQQIQFKSRFQLFSFQSLTKLVKAKFARSNSLFGCSLLFSVSINLLKQNLAYLLLSTLVFPFSLLFLYQNRSQLTFKKVISKLLSLQLASVAFMLSNAFANNLFFIISWASFVLQVAFLKQMSRGDVVQQSMQLNLAPQLLKFLVFHAIIRKIPWRVQILCCVGAFVVQQAQLGLFFADVGDERRKLVSEAN